MYIISVINKINNFTNDKHVFVDMVTVFAISHHDEPKNPNVDAIKNNRLIHNYLQTCRILWKNIYIFILFLDIFLRRMTTNV
jgi:hypothetical protein